MFAGDGQLDFWQLTRLKACDRHDYFGGVAPLYRIRGRVQQHGLCAERGHSPFSTQPEQQQKLRGYKRECDCLRAESKTLTFGGDDLTHRH